MGNQTVTAKAISVIRGLLIAAPLLIIFAALFASSDAVFSKILTRAFSFDIGEFCSHAGVTITCLWIVGGFLRRLFLAPPIPEFHGPKVQGYKLGLTEIVIVFLTMNSLFLAFVAIQFRYLFGGHALVQRTAHLSYAEYAHQGFFELLTVAILGLAVLVGAHTVVKSHEDRDWRAFAFLGFTLVTLIYVVMASALTRMQIYVQAYGITQERLYATAVLAWLALVFGWFCATSLRRRADRFAGGALASVLVVVLALNILNPDGLIVRVNTSADSARVDAAYLASLSQDAVPELIHALPSLRPEASLIIRRRLIGEQKALVSDDWRSWDISARDAYVALKTCTF